MESPNSPTPEYTANFDRMRTDELEFVDVETLSEGDKFCGDNILFAECFVCKIGLQNSKVSFVKCLHADCDTYICTSCMNHKSVKRGMRCQQCSTRFWLGRKRWEKCEVCFAVRCPVCSWNQCSHQRRHFFN